MNRSTVGEREQTVVTRLRISDGALLRPVLCRVISMVLARADWPLDRLEEALLVCDALCAQVPTRSGDGRSTFSVKADRSRAELCVLDIAEDRAEQLVHDSRLPLVGNVLEQLADAVSVERDDGAAGAQLTIVLSAS